MAAVGGVKRTLAELTPTYDFSRYNDLIDERIGPVVYWPEAFHFAFRIGAFHAACIASMARRGSPAANISDMVSVAPSLVMTSLYRRRIRVGQIAILIRSV